MSTTIIETTIKRSSMDPKDRPLLIADDTIAYDGKTIACPEIDAVKFGTLRTQMNSGAHISDTHEYQFRAGDQKLRITFMASKKQADAIGAVHERIANAVDQVVVSRLAQSFEESLDAGKPVTVGSFTLSKDGVTFKTGMLFRKDNVVDWANLRWTTEGGRLEVWHKASPKKRGMFPLMSTWNGVVAREVIRRRSASN